MTVKYNYNDQNNLTTDHVSIQTTSQCQSLLAFGDRISQITLKIKFYVKTFLGFEV